MESGFFYRAAVVLCLVVVLPIICQAQLPSGGITGVVTESSGAAVPAARVMVSDAARGHVVNQRR